MPEHVALPPVRAVAAGTWAIPVALPGSPLHYVIVYALETDDGIVLIDAGWDSEESWAALVDGLAVLGGRPDDVTGCIVTHIHPDHYGLAPRVRRESGAWLSLHPADLTMIMTSDAQVEEWLADAERWLTAAGAAREVIEEMAEEVDAVRCILRVEPPDLLIEHGDVPPVRGRELRALHTPGHTDGHLCFHEPGRALFYAGDHVLPKITPNVSTFGSRRPDPLGDFLDSLRLVRNLPCERVLPAHVTDFAGLPRRVDELIEHHAERLADIAGIVAAGAETVWEIAAKHPWKRGWDGLTSFMRRMAAGETEAHLHRLQVLGKVVARTDADGVRRWTPSG